jgi:7-cyano-7-deazaguanine synthase
MSEKSSICVLVSGGLDSDVLLAQMAQKFRRVVPVYVQQGLAWEAVELYWLKRFISALKNPRIQALRVIRLPMKDLYGNHWSTGRGRIPGYRSKDEAVYLPGRNLILTVKAAVLCAMEKIPNLALGSLGHNPFPDASPRFFKTWAAALSLGLRAPLRILAPYRHLSKKEVIQRGKDFPLHLSFSCLKPQGKKHCGACNKCAERQRAFSFAGLKDHTAYAKIKKN